jgi:hypothetical protein
MVAQACHCSLLLAANMNVSFAQTRPRQLLNSATLHNEQLLMHCANQKT